MAVKLLDNPYRGVNAHLHSMLQARSGEQWRSFHSSHVTDIARALNTVLPPNYVARAEESMQVIREDDDTKRPRIPDVGIFQTSESRRPYTSASRGAHVALLEMPDVLDDSDDDFVPAIIIRETDLSGGKEIVTWIELLSPANKPGHAGYGVYKKKRQQTLHMGIPLIEIDYLHEQPVTMRNRPVYPHDVDSHPYHIIVNDPRPNVETGKVWDHFFDVDSPLPTVDIPLKDSEIQPLDFNPLYHDAFRVMRWGQLIDYAELPPNFDTYSPDDQARIRAVMERVQSQAG